MTASLSRSLRNLALRNLALRKLRKLVKDRRGATAAVFAVLAVPLVAGAGIGVDVARAYAERVRLGQALDAAGLAVGSMQGTPDQLQAALDKYFEANYPKTDGVISASATMSTDASGNVITIIGHSTIKTTMMNVIGEPTITVGASSEVTKQNKDLEIALVLDNTGSMAGTKIATLKTAASNFVDTLANATAGSTLPHPVKISVIPYTMTVNIGSAYQNEPWMSGVMPSEYGADIFSSPGVNRFTLLSQMHTAWQGCVESRPFPYDTEDTPPSSGATLFVPYFAPDEPDNSNAYVNNYLTDASADRHQSWEIRQGDPAKYTRAPRTGTNGVGYQFGPNAGCIAQPLVRLTDSFSTVKAGIDGMVAGGDTNIAAGVMWGWHTLSPNAPFADGTAYSDDTTRKIMVLMTDGENHNVVTSSPDDSVYGGLGYIWQNRLGITGGSLDDRREALDNRLLAVCANAKAAGIEIYTIAFNVAPDAPDAHQMMQQCASSTNEYYDVANVSDLNDAFQSIANSIQNLHLSK